MNTDRPQPKSRPVTGRQGRPTIGVLAGDLNFTYVLNVWAGIVDAVRDRGGNLLCFEGGVLHQNPATREILHAPANRAYDLATSQLLDGIVITSTMVTELDPAQLHAFCRRFDPAPMILAGLSFPEIPGIVVDNTSGIRQIIQHFVEVHGYRRIAFIRGPERNKEAELRYRIYCETLHHYDIPVDPHLVLPGDFTFGSGKAAASRLSEGRPTGIEAIVAANDETALGALEVLQQHGIQVPHELALAGFDDIEEAATVTPPLTTIRQPMHTLGGRAVEMLFQILDGKPVDGNVVLPTELIVRQSCGCESPLVLHAASVLPDSADSALADMARQQGPTIRTQVRQAVSLPVEAEPAGWDEHLLNAFLEEVTGQSPGSFLSVLEEVAVQLMPANPNLNAWHDVISILRQWGLSGTCDSTLCARIETVTGQARILLGDLIQQIQGRHLNPQQFQQLQQICSTLSTRIELEQIVRLLTEQLPRLNIPACYLALYDDPDDPLRAARLALAYDETGQRPMPSAPFASTQLLPDGLLAREVPFALLLEPLVFRTQQIGFVLFGIRSREGRLYRSMGSQISSSLNTALLLQQERRAQGLLTVRPIIGHMQDVSALLGGASERLTAISTQMAAGVDQTSQQVGAMSAHSHQINQIIQQVSTAAQEGAQGITAIARTVTDIAQWVQQAVAAAQAAQNAVQNLDVNARHIGSVLEVIIGVAKQTKFLALYAAIVAAQSGAFSAGFSVVSKEVKTLAQETASSVKHIAQNMKAIQTNTQKAGRAILEVVKIIDQVAELSTVIHLAVAEQTEVAYHISKSIAAAAGDNEEMTRAIADVAATAQGSSIQAAQVQIAAQELFVLANQLGHLAQDIQTIQ